MSKIFEEYSNEIQTIGDKQIKLIHIYEIVDAIKNCDDLNRLAYHLCFNSMDDVTDQLIEEIKFWRDTQK